MYENDVYQINFLKDCKNFELDLFKIENCTQKDPILLQVYTYVMTGWPVQIDNPTLKPYFQRNEEISVVNNVLMWGHRVIIPENLQQLVLKELHNTHMGIVKMKSLARSYVWWPSLNKDIENTCKSCMACQKQKKSPNAGTLQSWPIPEGIWERLHVDFLGPIRGKYCLIVIDAFSKWLEVFVLSTISSSATIDKLRGLFAQFGLPKTICSDNGGQFTSQEFCDFLKLNGIKHVTSPPYNASSNGAAENSVKTVKQFLLKELNSGSDHFNFHVSLHRFLMIYRITEHCSTGETPSNVFLGRQIRSRFDLLKPENSEKKLPKSLNDIKNNLKMSQDRNLKYFKGRREEKFSVGQCVYTKDYKNVLKPTWAVGHIVKILGKNVYLINIYKTDLIWKRHLNQIRSGDINSISEPGTTYLEDKNDSEGTSQNGSDYGAHANNVIDLTSEDDLVVNPMDLAPEVRGGSPVTGTSRPRRVRKSPDRLKY